MDAENNGRPKLLLVDDDEALCSVLGRALEKREFEVLVAHDHEAAIATASLHRPTFAVLDLKLGASSGLRLMSRLLALEASMRVVVLTGYASIATAMEAVRLGAHHYLTKPADADEVVAALRRESGAPSSPISEKPLSVNRLEWEHINRVLLGNNGNISATARVLRMHRRTLQRKLNKHPARS